jgi:hypothetical protein
LICSKIGEADFLSQTDTEQQSDEEDENSEEQRNRDQDERFMSQVEVNDFLSEFVTQEHVPLETVSQLVRFVSFNFTYFYFC